MEWTPEALALLHKIPFFARLQARRQIEDMAAARGLEQVTLELVEEARSRLGQ